MAKILTAAAVGKMKAGATRREVPDAHTPGLYLVLQPSGRRSFAVRTRVQGKPAKITLKALGLADARREAEGIITAAREGKDPRQIKADAEAARPVTFAELADAYLERWAKPRKKTWKEDEADIKRDLLPTWGKRSAAEITRRDVLAVLEAKAATAPIRSNRLRALLSRVFGFGMDADLVPASPVAGVKPLSKERQRDRVLTDAELLALWRVWDTHPLGTWFKLALLTGQRRGELANMRWADLDLDLEAPVWRLSAASTKAGRAHEVPLAEPVVDLLRKAPKVVTDAKTGATAALVFTTNGRTPISGFSKAKVALDRAMLAEMQKLEEERAKGRDETAAKIELAPWRIHDLRRTAASGMARLGTPPHVLAKILNHTPGSAQGVTAIYNRHGYDREKRHALVAWAAHVLALVEERPGNVVALRA
jgi:integrase